MEWELIKKLRGDKFQRMVGVKRPTFDKMLEILYHASSIRASKRGRPAQISIETQLLIMLMYYREYRTFFHIAGTYRISEAQCWRIVRKTESLLLESNLFHLPGKKQLLDGNSWDIVVIDVAESPIERPKKNSESITPGRRSGTL